MPRGIYKRTKEHNENISKGRLERKKRLGYLISDEAKKKISNTLKGRRLSLEVREKISKSHIGIGKGVPLSEKHKEKISKSRKGQSVWNKGIKHSKKTRQKISNNTKGLFKGSNNPAWKGGKSFEPYGLEFNNELKEKIRKRDSYKCRECRLNQKELYGRLKKLDIHHIDYDKRNNNEKNLITLCRPCHCKTGFNRKDWTKYFNQDYAFK